MWNNLINNFENSAGLIIDDCKEEVFEIKQELMHHTILRYF
jgi:hypothetical protein